MSVRLNDIRPCLRSKTNILLSKTDHLVLVIVMVKKCKFEHSPTGRAVLRSPLIIYPRDGGM